MWPCQSPNFDKNVQLGPFHVSRLIYAIGCKDCPRVYLEEMGRTADQRSREHNAPFRFGRKEQSAIACHAIEENQSIHWDQLVIEKEGHVVKRKVKEALRIREVKTK